MKSKILLSLLVIVVSVSMVVGGTLAYFTDRKAGAIMGSIGSIKVNTSELNLAFNNLLPGEPQTVTVNYQNTGNNTQDVWLVFPNKTALSALNSLGTYGAAQIWANGAQIFTSSNLNDHPVDQGTNCKAIPKMIQIASNVAPGASGSVSFVFNYASKMESGAGGVWNTYPLVTSGTLAGAGWPNDGNQAGFDQNYANTADGSGSGLPYAIVATQVGQNP